VALASGAYAIGSQSGDGNAVAGSGDRQTGGPAAGPWRGGLGPNGLADSLGVDATKLADAFADFHKQKSQEHRQAFADELAGALGVSAEKVTAALEETRAKHLADFAGKLASELGLEAAKVQAALEKLAGKGPGPHGGPGQFDELAAELGVDEAELGAALREIRPDRPGRHGPRAADLRELAGALGVEPSKLRAALRQLGDDARSRRDEHRDELAAYLAERFNLEVAKVEEALADLPRPGPPGRDHHGPPPGAWGDRP
jgi:transcriptional regulator with XRE-family HTH domain